MKTLNFKLLLLVVALLANSQEHAIGLDFFVQKAKNAVMQSAKNSALNACTFVCDLSTDAYAFAQANPGKAAKIVAKTASMHLGLCGANIALMKYNKSEYLNCSTIVIWLSITGSATTLTNLANENLRSRNAARQAAQAILEAQLEELVLQTAALREKLARQALAAAALREARIAARALAAALREELARRQALAVAALREELEENSSAPAA